MYILYCAKKKKIINLIYFTSVIVVSIGKKNCANKIAILQNCIIMRKTEVLCYMESACMRE